MIRTGELNDEDVEEQEDILGHGGGGLDIQRQSGQSMAVITAQEDQLMLTMFLVTYAKNYQQQQKNIPFAGMDRTIIL